MPTIKTLPSGSFQLTVRNKLLPKPFYSTFSTFDAAEKYGERLKGLLKQNIVPASLMERKSDDRDSWLVSRCIVEYVKTGSVPNSEVKILDTIRPSLMHDATSQVDFNWCEAWVNRMKHEDNLKPGTIRHRVGALRRCFDWMGRKHPDIMVSNPLQQLKKGFANYHDEDARILALEGKEIKQDESRIRRFEDDEEKALMAAMVDMPHEHTFLNLALETAMRMREIYTLTVDQVSFAKRTIHLSETKNGDSRQVPMSSVAIPLMKAYLATHAKEIKARKGIVFPYWNGGKSKPELDITTSSVSKKFKAIFKIAKLKNFHFHDLRHEATSRLFERTKMSDLTIAKITGHRSIAMLMRYANIRGSLLAWEMW